MGQFMTMEPNKYKVDSESILWRGIVLPGHEVCRLFFLDSEWHIEGTAVFAHEGQPVQLNYQVVCDAAWKTLSAQVEGWLAKTVIDLRVKTDSKGVWWLNEVEQPDVMGCIDIDLNFSPSTNLLPIRRLDLPIGEAADINAAWLRFPSFKFETLPQRYRHLTETTYRYESSGGQFVADLQVNGAGFVIDYPGLWQSEIASE
jgi:uncharacterized protein